MKPVQTGKNYDTIVDRWTESRFDMSNGIEQHKRAISFLDSRGKALDVGCGCTGRFMDLLAAEGFEPEGLDVSAEMIALARERDPEYSLFHADICEFRLQEKYDFITAWDSIWHIPLEQQAGVVLKLIDALNPGGVIIFSFGGVDEPGEHTNDAMGLIMYYASLGTHGFFKLIHDSGCAIKHMEFDQRPELHAYLIAKKLPGAGSSG